MIGISIEHPMTTVHGLPVPTEWSYIVDCPLEIGIRTLIPGRGWRTWNVSRDAISDIFDQWSVTRGAAKITVTGQTIRTALALGAGRWMILVGRSAPVHDFIQTTFDLCPPCAGCTNDTCLSCTALRRQINVALAELGAGTS